MTDDEKYDYSELEFNGEMAQKINDYIFLDSRRYDGYAGDNL